MQELQGLRRKPGRLRGKPWGRAEGKAAPVGEVGVPGALRPPAPAPRAEACTGPGGGTEGGDGHSRSLGPCSRALACPPATPGSFPGRLQSAPPRPRTEVPAPPARKSRESRASLGRATLCGPSWERQEPQRLHLRSAHCADMRSGSVTWTSHLVSLGHFSKRWPRVIVSACPTSQVIMGYRHGSMGLSECVWDPARHRALRRAPREMWGPRAPRSQAES